MAQGIKIGRRHKVDPAEEEERRMILEGMAQTRQELEHAYAQFNIHSDPDLVEACVFEINALRSRYSYFVRQIKRLEEKKEAAG